MDLSMSSSREDPFASDSIFSQQDLPVVPNDNPETYCRLCLTTPDVVPLFPPGTDPNVYVLELIGQYIGVGLTMEDDSSCAVCTSCQLILDQFDLFRQNCLKVDIAIRRRRLGLDRVVKSEPLQDDDEEEIDLPYKRLENRCYQCRVCSEKFRSMSLFMGHCKEQHPDEAKMYKCKHCTKSFMTKTARLQHIRSHQPTNADGDLGAIRMQVCEKCMITFESYKLLKDHIKEQHSNDPKQETLVCGTCSRQFSRITILRNHILRVHLGKQPHVCKQCGFDFAYSQQLVAHLKTEHGISPDEFGQFAEDHLEDEEGVPPSAGSESDPAAVGDAVVKTEPQPTNTNASAEADERKRMNRYACIDCSVNCASTEELRNHRKIHQDPTWWKCNNCRNLVKHQQMHLQKKHPTISESELDSSFTIRYRCWMCRMYFKTLHQMEVHANVKHQIPLPEHHQVPTPSDELEEGEIRPEIQIGAPASTVPPPSSTLIHAAAAGLPSGIPQPLTAQPPLPFAAEHFPMLLSQLENGALDYLREFSRLIDPNNQLGLAAQLDIKPNVAALNASMAMDLSGNSALNLSNFTSAVNSTRNSDVSMDVAEDESESEDDTFIRLDNRTYQCKFCPETFRHMQLMRKHTKIQHPSEWKCVKCAHCKRRFPSAPIRDRHAHFHRLDHPCKCTECDQMYSTQKRLDKHFQIFHDRTSHSFSLERFKCGSCEMTFVEKKYYDLHTRIYHEKKPQRLKNLSEKIQVCERCFTKFDSRELLMDHIRQKHQGDPPLKNCVCTTCQKDLKTITLLRIHILVVHMGISPFVCQHCNADFASRHWLLKHMEKEHSEIALFKCQSCDDSFTTEARLIEHKDKAHTEVITEYDAITGTMVYPCTKCEKKLATKELLEKHLIKAHPSFMMMYKCPLCTQPIRYRKQHMQVHHKIEYNPKEHQYQLRYKCHCCSKMFQQKRNLLAHQNSLSFQCSRCQMRFKTKKNLQAHMSAHKSNKCLKCEDCGLDFGYRARLDTHRERYHSPTSTRVLKIINCPYCPKLFISKSNRERHIAANHVQSEFKVNCNHCQVQVTDTAQLRKHYKAVHPDERVTFKCPACERFYLNLSSFKDHYKKHKEEAEKSSNSTVDGSEAEADVSTNKTKKIKQEVQDAKAKTVEIKQENADVSGSSQEKVNDVKLEFENGEVVPAADDVKVMQDTVKLEEPMQEATVAVKVENEEKVEITDPKVEDGDAKEQAEICPGKDHASSEPEAVEQIPKNAEKIAEGTVHVPKADESDEPMLVDQMSEKGKGSNQADSSKVAESGEHTTNAIKDSKVETKEDTAAAKNSEEGNAIAEKEDPIAPVSSDEPMEVEDPIKVVESKETKMAVQELSSEHKECTVDIKEQTQEDAIPETLESTEKTKQPESTADQAPLDKTIDGKEAPAKEQQCEQELASSAQLIDGGDSSQMIDQQTSDTNRKTSETTAEKTIDVSEAELAVEKTKIPQEPDAVSNLEMSKTADTTLKDESVSKENKSPDEKVLLPEVVETDATSKEPSEKQEKSEQAPVTTQEKAAVTTPEQPPVTTPEQASVTTLEQAPVMTPEQAPVKTPEQSPVTTPEQAAATTLEQAPVTTPEQLPVTTPEQAPITTPEQGPVTTPEQALVKTPEQAPVTTPEQAPITTPEQAAITTPEQAVNTTPEQASVTTPEQASVTTPEQASETPPEKAPATTPEQAPVTKPRVTKQRRVSRKPKAKQARANELKESFVEETMSEDEKPDGEETKDSSSIKIKTSLVKDTNSQDEPTDVEKAKQELTPDNKTSPIEEAKAEETKLDVEEANTSSNIKISSVTNLEERKSDAQGVTDIPPRKPSEVQKKQGKLPIRKNAKQSKQKRVGKQPKVKQKTSDEEINSEVSANESKLVDEQFERDIVLENSVVLDETAPLRDDVPQVATSSYADENESKSTALVESTKMETAQRENNETEKTKPNGADVPSVDKEQIKNDFPLEPPENVNNIEAVPQQSNEKQLEKIAEEPEVLPSAPEAGHSAAERAEDFPVKPENEPNPPEENSKDETQPAEENRSTNNSPTSVANDSPFTIVESSNDASEISETSSVTSERSSVKRKATPASEGRRISTRNVHKRKKRLMVLLDPVDVDRLMELSRGSSVSPSLDRITRKGSASARASSSESQPATEDQLPAKRLRRERRTPNSEGSGVTGDSWNMTNSPTTSFR